MCSLAGLATSADVERLFSRGRLVLSHVRNRLSAQSTRAILCLGAWSKAGFVSSKDEMRVCAMGEVPGDELEVEMVAGWDSIDVNRVL